MPTMLQTTDETTALLSSLKDRIAALEKSSWSAGTRDEKKDDADATTGTAAEAAVVDITPELRRARRHVQSTGCYSSEWKLCPPNYYELGLDERRGILGAQSTSQLCKACLFENKNFVEEEKRASEKDGTCSSDPTNSRYYLIVVQYVESINTKKLGSELRGLRLPGRFAR